MVKKIIKSEKEFSKWFVKNFEKLGYDKILRKDQGKFPDYVMERKGKKVLVELETLSSNFILHKHDPKKVDEVLCIENDAKLPVKTIKIEELKYKIRLARISFTISEKTANLLTQVLKKGKYRNRSHAVEEAIKLLKNSQ